MYVNIDNVSKTIRRKTVLNAVSAQFERGKVYGILGPNGSGKTMLLRTLCGFIKPTSGSITINGTPVTFNHKLPENIGIIIETPGFAPSRSAMDNLRYLADINHAFDSAEVERLMRLFDLWDHRNDKVKSYSLGMRQKLAIVQAFMEHQRLVLLDEPTNGLDWRSVEQFMKEVNYQREQGHTIIIASHHNDELGGIVDAALLMRNGVIERQVAPDEIASLSLDRDRAGR
ncbi:ABC transporter ATP-binding protein [Bifidobacterium oedipodis]|uniref:ABC transporter n=1 Tax=Bifidobacterium oedipodis TaxID=2675322 RepID=A0A7Y0HST0_9BIFI|nr:ABC transporter ATP-binding protein [Bifidobacterium sp. DSM 109957]NMM94336.1 ABC transporter [Bifidobacterium sp. DSM 109957]